MVVGAGFESLLSPMPLEIEMQDGLSLLRRKVVSEVRLRVYHSVGGQVRVNDGEWHKIISRDVLQDRMDSAITPKTQVVQVQTPGGYSHAPQIEVRQTGPLPFNLIAITTIYGVTE